MAARSQVIDGKKRCGRCGEWKLVGEFYKNPKASTGLSSGCVPCTLERKAISRELHYDPEKQRAYQAKYRSKHPERVRAFDHAQSRRSKLRRLGAEADWYERQLAKQNGCCAICLREETATYGPSKEVRPLAIDHDHKTGELRGLLCTRCNTAIGLLQEDRTRFMFAIDYLDGHYR